MWLVVSSEAKQKTRAGEVFFSFFQNRIFELPSPRNAKKRDRIKPRKNQFGIFLSIFFIFFVKTFRHDFFVKRFL
jgi:hypothetical protein